jgi:SH3 domain protein
MKFMKQIFILIAGLWLSASAFAETAYVTDMLQLNVYATSDLAGSPLKKLRSGDTVDVVTRSGRVAEVKVAGGPQGWVKSLYLVTDEPARTRVNQLERTNENLDSTAKKLRSQLKAEKNKLTELQAAQDGSDEQRVSVEEELEQLRSANEQLTSRLAAYGMNVPFSWLLIAALIALAGGFAGSWYWIDKRNRARHGGYRVY